jgi:L-ascorbate metabolism protein UlaG (beta-lactamase superfamily)
MHHIKKPALVTLIIFVLLLGLLLFATFAPPPGYSAEKTQKVSDHYDGNIFFNPDQLHPSSARPESPANRSIFWFAWRWIFNDDRPEWPEIEHITPAVPPTSRVAAGTIRIITVGHATFLIQMDGLNILTDPIWSERCSPVSWAGPKRHKPAGIRLEDLPPIDAVLVSHNHYDHLDLPTLRNLAERGASRIIVPLGNLDLIRDTGIPVMDELDWWQSIPLTPAVTVTLVPARHFSSRTPWDRNKMLWGGFVISGPSGNVYFAGDTGYGSHFAAIARRFSPIRVALLPISPYQPQQTQTSAAPNFSGNHTGPAEAVQAHIDLKAQLSIADHFQVFQMGWDGFDDAVNDLSAALKEHNLTPDKFIAPVPGQIIEINVFADRAARKQTVK